MKTLIIYYSHSGITEKVAKFVAKKTGSDVETITALNNRKGPLCYVTLGYEATFGKCAKIAGIKSKIEDYDIVIIATPIWAGKTSSPVNAFLSGFGSKIKNYAVIVTRANMEKDFDSVKEIFQSKLKKEPLAFLSMSTQSVKDGRFEAADDFVKTIKAIS